VALGLFIGRVDDEAVDGGLSICHARFFQTRTGKEM
jgi:hypothetical protein